MDAGFPARKPIIATPDRKNAFMVLLRILSLITEPYTTLKRVKPILAVLVPVFQSLLA